jgi:hypothetical protein
VPSLVPKYLVILATGINYLELTGNSKLFSGFAEIPADFCPGIVRNLLDFGRAPIRNELQLARWLNKASKNYRPVFGTLIFDSG